MVKISLTKLDPGPLNFSMAEWALFSFPMLKYQWSQRLSFPEQKGGPSSHGNDTVGPPF